MSNIVVIGGGFAAVWSAAAAARRRHEAGLDNTSLSIVVVAPGDDMVIRPRLYEPEPETMRVELRRVLDPIEVRHMRATVTGIDVAAGDIVAVTATGDQHVERFDRLILASGSQLVRRDEIPGATLFHDIDTLPAAVALDRHLKELPLRPADDGRYAAVVVGAGFVGLEIATELVTRLRAIAAPHGGADVR